MSRGKTICCLASFALPFLAVVLILPPNAQTVPPNASRPGTQSSGGDKSQTPPRAWPPDIDESVPPTTQQPCPLPEILQGVSERTQELVGNLKSFSATETLNYTELNKNGEPGEQKKAEVSYVAEFRDVGRGIAQIEEYRNDTKLFPVRSTLAVSGTVTAALIFHPKFVGNFTVDCEGMSNATGRPAWQVHFVQRPNTEDFRSYNVNGTWYSVTLKGRAWIAPDTYQVLRMEHDVAQTIPRIRLVRDYVAVDYAAVDFPRHGVQMWLPQRSTMYIDFRGRRYKLTHDFANFKVFWVETQQELNLPKTP